MAWHLGTPDKHLYTRTYVIISVSNIQYKGVNIYIHSFGALHALWWINTN